ncbi:autophagy protein 6 [Apophysomyces sp. BC1034]|nr:autophagy protein 6 [Apophysomyces sp. BC1015]KAG0179747.1 autophagy protein 6 [Apophysomyces sp. BC1021]KAG0190286.1 autophagy protein 6 [Apophysomyces sp. BC1034]
MQQVSSMQSFQCQRCKQPLRVDDSLADLDSAAADLLIAPLTAEEQFQQQVRQNRGQKFVQDAPAYSAADPVSRRVIDVKLPLATVSSRSAANKHKRDTLPAPSESFVVLSRSQVAPIGSVATTSGSGAATTAAAAATLQSQTSSAGSNADSNWQSPRNNSLSHRLKVANRLFDVMSSKSSVDHPMCQECTDMLLESLERQLEDVSRERDCYIDFLRKVKDSRISVQEEEELQKQVEELKLAQGSATAELKKVQEEREALARETEELELEMKALDEREEKFWEKCNEYQIRLQTFQNERDSINLKYDYDVKQYERLQKTVVYNDAFSISHDGPFGTINGFRLGRLSSHPVEWSEINAAWGQTLLLLYTVASKLKFQFQTYRLVPMGSFSRVEKIDGDSVLPYELYGSGDFGLNRMFLNRRFDHAMVAILNCLKQLTDFAEERDRSLRLPYRINKDKIGELSIRLQFNQDELWTKALKYMLTNMKWILAFASRANVGVETFSNDVASSLP